jgi:hypothetical protein
MAKHFAYRMQKKAGSNVKQQIKTGFELATNHAIDDESLQSFLKLYRQAIIQFKDDNDKTCDMLGGMSADTNPETAALTVVANAILNLDEVLTKN